MAKRSWQPGEFEEIVLLTVGVLYDDAYAVNVSHKISEETGSAISLSAVHKSLYRLERKGMLTSRLGAGSTKRGGKRKRQFYISPYGKKALDNAIDLRTSLRNQLRSLVFPWEANAVKNILYSQISLTTHF